MPIPAAMLTLRILKALVAPDCEQKESVELSAEYVDIKQQI